MTFKVLTVAFSMVVICSIPNANTDEKQAATPSETLPMYQVNQDNLPEEFIRAWQYAGQHIKGKAEGDIHWMRATLDQPIAEHLSFRLGNQLFFVYLSVQKNSEWIMSYDIEDLFIRVADEANAIPCIMSMIDEGNGYKPANAGWGLLHAQTGETIDPRALVTDELIEMSDWELHNFAMQVVKQYLGSGGAVITAWQSDLKVDPSIWFRKGDDLYWVVVRWAPYPMKHAEKPSNIEDIKFACIDLGKLGFFASIIIANAQDSFDPSQDAMPLYRGHELRVKFEGLEPL